MSRLVVVGSGIKSLAHLSQETIAVIKEAAKVLYLVNEPLMKEWIQRECEHSESLDSIYFTHAKRIDAYHALTEYILSENARLPSLCVIFYGHPVMFASSALRAVQEVKKENKQAVILPAISSLDCLFADLAIDPGVDGYYSVDATDFLIYQKKFDLCSDLILWQIGNLGMHDLAKTKSLSILQDYLLNFYPENHQLCIYEAAQYPTAKPRRDYFSLSCLYDQNVTGISTLYVPALQQKILDWDMLKKLGMEVNNFLRNSSHSIP